MTSADTRPVFREHGRFTTTAIRAATMPVMERYFNRLESSLKDAGFIGRLMILKSSGGITGVDYAKQHPEELIESGPAGGVAYAAYLSQLKGDCPNIIHTDVGGTSFDVSIMENGKGLVTRDHEIEWEIPVIVPMLDIHSVGAGGGSIGWVDEGGSLRVGPHSAGSEPGPVCYGCGGKLPTITDANLLLGRIEPTLGGKMQLDRAAAEAAMERLAEEFGLSALETADGMIRIGCESMAQAVKKVIVARGRDPRDFILASFGGAGAMPACFVADSMNIPRIIVPREAGVASAFGATAMDLRHDLEAFYFSPVAAAEVATVNRMYEQLEKDAIALLEADGLKAADVQLTRSAQMRYVGQSYEVETPIPSGKLTAADLPAIASNFHKCHEMEFGVSSDDFAPAIVSLGVTVVGKTARPPVRKIKVTVDTAVIDQTKVDPVTFEVLRSIFEYASERMSTVLKRASFSPILADMVDFSNAIYDYECKLLSQAANCPIHLAAMKFSAEAIIEQYPPSTMQPGDVYVLNDSYKGGTHINDMTFLSPIFFDGDIIAFGVSRGHWMDLGGGAAGGQAFAGTHIAGEGLRLPPLKLYEAGKVREDLLAIIMNNTRTPFYVKGDTQAHVGALKAATQEMERAAEKYGMATLKAAMQQL